MDLWKILVLGTLRLNCNFDYDKVHGLANNHRTLRLMLGHAETDMVDHQTSLPLGNLIMNLIPESAQMFFIKSASIQIFTFKMPKISTVIDQFAAGYRFCFFRALTFA